MNRALSLAIAGVAIITTVAVAGPVMPQMLPPPPGEVRAVCNPRVPLLEALVIHAPREGIFTIDVRSLCAIRA